VPGHPVGSVHHVRMSNRTARYRVSPCGTFPKSSEAPLARLSTWLCGCADLMAGSPSPTRS
jgi:hypothetical protein